MKTKKLLYLLTIFWIYLFVIIFPCSVQAADSGTYGDNLTWNLTDDGVLTIGGEGAMSTSVDIPWDVYSSAITNIVIEDGVTTIRAAAFSEYSKLTEVTFPNTLTEVGDSAFRKCTSLKSVDLPDTNTKIGTQAFYECTSLTHVSMGEQCKSIGDRAFYMCYKLTDYTLPTNLESIGNYALAYTQVSELNLPATLSVLGNNVFDQMSALTSLTIDKDNETFAIVANVLYTKDMSTLLLGCPGISGSIAIPDGVTTISANAFYGCTGLTAITIPDSVTSIGASAFNGCTNLTDITFPDNLVITDPTILAGTGYYNNKDNWEDGFLYFGTCLLYGSTDTTLTEYAVKEGTTSIAANVFENYTALTTITLPDTITDIGSSAFYNCSALTDITLPASLTALKEYTFANCTSLTSIIIPANVTYTESFVFYGCENYTVTVLSWDCVLHSSFAPGVTAVYGYANSTAATFAETNGYTFTTLECTNHVYAEEVITAPTCTDSGEVKHICYTCGDNYKETTAELGHDYGDWTILVEGNCTTAEEKEQTCSRCNYTYHYYGGIPGHDYQITDSVESTCAAVGHTTYVCSVCNDSYTTEHTPINHDYDYDHGEVIKAATTTEFGITRYTCSNCGGTLDETERKIATLTVAESKVILDGSATTNPTYKINYTYIGDGTVEFDSGNSNVKVDSNGNVTVAKNYSGQCAIFLYANETDNYAAEAAQVNFIINKIPRNIMVSDLQVTTSSTKAQSFKLDIKYQGQGDLSCKTFKNPHIYVADNGTVTIAKGYVGKTTISVQVAESEFYASEYKRITLTVLPEKTTITKLQNLNGKKLKVTWKSKYSATRYEIQYATNKNFKNAKSVIKKGYQKNNVTLTNLTKNKTYYVRIRIISRGFGKDYYSGWSSASKLKITK